MPPSCTPAKVEPVHSSFPGHVGKSERDVAEHGHGAGLPATTTSHIHQYWRNSGRQKGQICLLDNFFQVQENPGPLPENIKAFIQSEFS